MSQAPAHGVAVRASAPATERTEKQASPGSRDSVRSRPRGSRSTWDDCRFKITPVIDLAGQTPVDAWEIPDRHRQAVHLMTPADTFPFSPSTSRTMQIDHTEPYVPKRSRRDHAGGQSRVGNYGPMTTTHHRIKTHGGWQVKQPFPGIYLWRDPHGAFYLVDHTGTRKNRASSLSRPRKGPTADRHPRGSPRAARPRRPR